MWKTIFGIPHGSTEAAQPQPEQPPMYRPESRLTERQIHGVGEDGPTWQPWRVDADGEQWYVNGISAGDDDFGGAE